MNKRGAELTIGTLVIIVLAVIVLVVLVVGFTQGWGNLWANISQFFGTGGANIDTVVSACNTACLTNSKNAWCNQKRDVKADSDVFVSVVNGKFVPIEPANAKPSNEVKGETCKTLLANTTGLGFQSCPAIICG
ncbi:hypothetical protein HYV49_06405 [Candidatus Pacearchaeota archaeon]|nr:hypothetical protein [Candidatus Pacearchaeota archaeon]